MRNVLDKSCRENRNTFYVQQIFSENLASDEIMSKHVVQPEVTIDVTIWHICFAYCISKTARAHAHAHAHAPATHTHTLSTHARARTHTHTHTNEYVILLVAFPRQQ